MTNIFPGLFF